MKYIFAPGCALLIYKPHLVDKIYTYLKSVYGSMEILTACCRNIPKIENDTCVINICPGCDKRYRENYTGSSTISLWELLADTDSFQFPNYSSQKMTIIDACPTRDQERVHNAVRKLAVKMNIDVVEPGKTRTKSTCCGDSYYDKLPIDKVISLMKAKADEMPPYDIIVYCVSCAKSMFVGNRHPRYLVDLLFGETTTPKTYQPDLWHNELDKFIESHK